MENLGGGQGSTGNANAGAGKEDYADKGTSLYLCSYSAYLGIEHYVSNNIICM